MRITYIVQVYTGDDRVERISTSHDFHQAVDELLLRITRDLHHYRHATDDTGFQKKNNILEFAMAKTVLERTKPGRFEAEIPCGIRYVIEAR